MTIDSDADASSTTAAPPGAPGSSLPSRPRRTVPARRRIAAALVLLALAAVVLWPAPIDGTRAERVRPLLDLLEAAGIPAWLSYGTLEFAANVALFVPVGFVVSRLLDGPLLRVAPLIGIALSAAAEGAQLLIVVQRTPDPRDLVSNTLGFAIGWLVVLVTRRRAQGRPIPR